MVKALYPPLLLLVLLIHQSVAFLVRPDKPTIYLANFNQQRLASMRIMRRTQKNDRLSAKQNDEEADDTNKVMGVFKKNPGTIIIVPFVALFGFDLVANIAVVTKRSLEGELLKSAQTWLSTSGRLPLDKLTFY